MIIIYNSNTGITKKYAEILSSKLNIKCISFKDRKTIDRNEEIIFMGWIFANNITKLNKMKNYNVKYAIGVGLNKDSKENMDVLVKVNSFDPNRILYLQGGIDYTKLKGIKKVLLKMVAKKNIKENKIEPEAIEVFKNGGDFITEEAVNKIIDKIQC